MTPSEICASAAPAARRTAKAVITLRENVMGGAPFEPVESGRSDSEVAVQLVHVTVELVVGDHVDDLPVLHHVVPVGHGGGEAEVLLDEQDGEALDLEPADGRPDLLHDYRRESLGGLVEEEQAC